MNLKIKHRYIYLIVIFLFGFIPSDKNIYLKISRSIEVFGKVYKEVMINYVDEIDPEEFMHAGIDGMLSLLDPYTVFFDESMQKDFDVITNGKYGGIGASVGVRNDRIIVLDIIDDTPAQRQGLKIGDVIFSVNGQEINKSNFEKLSNEITGEPGKEVNIVVERYGIDSQIKFVFRLEQIEIKNISYAGFYPESSNIAYIKLSNFSRGAGQELKQVISELGKIKKIESVILDLRDNPGGLLDQAIDVSEKFLDKGKLIVSVAGRDTTKKINYYSEEEPVFSKTGLIVIVNENTASAAEIVAGAIQDHDRGLIVGKSSFGKGLVQTVIPISNNTSIKITTAKYFTPSGRCLQKIDYLNKDKENSKIKTTRYFTDNSRSVYSRGGITPDTIFNDDSQSELLDDLKAKNLISDFSSFYVNKNESIDYSKIDSELIYKEFLEFLYNKNYSFSSDVSIKAKKLFEELDKQKYSVQFKSRMETILSELEDRDKQELRNQKEIIINYIRREVYKRIIPKSSRYKFLLANDDVVKFSVDLIEKNKVKKLLGKN